MDSQLTVTRLNTCQWLLDWQLNQWPKDCSVWEDRTKHRFKCGGLITYELRFSCSHSCLMYFVETYNDVTPWSEKGPLKVSAIRQGAMIMLPLTCGVFHGFVPIDKETQEPLTLNETFRNSSHRLPSIQLVLEFEDPFRTSYQKTNGEKRVLQHLFGLFFTGLLSDIEFIVQGQNFKAHAAIVAAGSPVFAAMFKEGKFKEAQTKTVIIEDIEADVFRWLLRYLYTGEVYASNITESLFVAAEKYQIDSLKAECEIYLGMNLTVCNVVHRLVLGHLHSAADLEEKATQFIFGEKEEIWFRPEWKKLVDTYPHLFYAVTQKMVTGQ